MRIPACRLLDTIGSPQVHPEVELIIEVHDKLTRCGETLPLA